MVPLEFVIPERPVSRQARRQERIRSWKAFVAAHAREALVEPWVLATQPIKLKLLYFYDEVALDIDNVMKPIQDALIGVVFEDDGIITDIEIRRRSRDAKLIVEDASPVLIAGLNLGREFVYVSLSDAPPQDVL